MLATLEPFAFQQSRSRSFPPPARIRSDPTRPRQLSFCRAKSDPRMRRYSTTGGFTRSRVRLCSRERERPSPNWHRPSWETRFLARCRDSGGGSAYSRSDSSLLPRSASFAGVPCRLASSTCRAKALLAQPGTAVQPAGHAYAPPAPAVSTPASCRSWIWWW
jgi:hypothetical protein